MRRVPVVHFTDVLKGAAAAASRRLPFSLIRLGDTEIAVLEHPETDIDVNEPHVGWPPGWQMNDQTIAELARRYASALPEADAVGMIWSDWETTGRIARAVESRTDGSIRAVCSTLGFRRPADEGIDELHLLIHGRRVLCIGSQACKWGRAIQLLGGRSCPWPYSDDPRVETIQDYEHVVAWALAIRRRDPTVGIALIALGPWAGPLCHELQRTGLIALDLGAGVTSLPEALPIWLHRLLERIA
ncbi:MAG: hypothetical protein AMJ84_03690 [Acidithiobacillales bacterium SM23_46]|nr:MAG: hypothetical protein AMJ84_03690 [Acidithiobacillales bacterium SM23_46]